MRFNGYGEPIMDDVAFDAYKRFWKRLRRGPYFFFCIQGLEM